MSTDRQSDSQTVQIAAEDCFFVVELPTSGDLAPHPDLIQGLAGALAPLENWQPIWDLRGTENDLYVDAVEAYAAGVEVSKGQPTVLASPGQEGILRDVLTRRVPHSRAPRILPTSHKPLLKRTLRLDPFSDESTSAMLDGIELAEAPGFELAEEWAQELARERRLRDDISVAAALGVLDEEKDEWDLWEEESRRHWDALFELRSVRTALEAGINHARSVYLREVLEQIGSQSLLTQLAMVEEGDRIRLVPMHANSLHGIDRGSELLAVRPARSGAATQWATFGTAIGELEELISDPRVNEGEIEALLQRNPLFLRGLNYSQVYHQVVLPLGEGRSMRPDIIAEPASGEWAEIIELKLPDQPIYVGYGDRTRLSAAIAEAAAQLRSYSRFFDDRMVAKQIESRYGFSCYQPRQVVIIGRDPRQFTEQQRNAAQSAYPDLRIVTYDQLLKAARDRLLF